MAEQICAAAAAEPAAAVAGPPDDEEPQEVPATKDCTCEGDQPEESEDIYVAYPADFDQDVKGLDTESKCAALSTAPLGAPALGRRAITASNAPSDVGAARSAAAPAPSRA